MLLQKLQSLVWPLIVLTLTRNPYSVFKQVVRVTLESNLGTALVALVDAIMFSKLESQWHVTMNLLLSKAYIISFLYTRTSASVARAMLACSLLMTYYAHTPQ